MARRWISLDGQGELPDGGAREFRLPREEGSDVSLIVLRKGDRVYAYENHCPHLGTPLNWLPDEFLDATGEHLICSTHGALFRVDDGFCLEGPCLGDRLSRIPAELRDGVLYVEETL